MDVAGGGVLVRREAVRELVRDMECDANRSLVVSRSFSRRSATSFSREDTSTGRALPNGLERELSKAELDVILGEERGLGLAEVLVERGMSSSLRRVSCGVGGVELLGDVLPRGFGLGREELRQSFSSAIEGTGGSLGGPISDRPLNPPPSLPPAVSSPVEGVNLLPFVHFSSVSAGPVWPSGVEKPELFLAMGGSGSERGARRDGRLERHCSAPSATLGGGRSDEGPSKRRREASRELGKSGRGPSRRQGLSNLVSSSKPPPKPPRSFGGSATLTRIVRLQRFAPLFANASFKPSSSSNSIYPKPLGFSSLSLIIFTAFVLWPTKNSSRSISVRSKARFPINAVYGG